MNTLLRSHDLATGHCACGKPILLRKATSSGQCKSCRAEARRAAHVAAGRPLCQHCGTNLAERGRKTCQHCRLYAEPYRIPEDADDPRIEAAIERELAHIRARRWRLTPEDCTCQRASWRGWVHEQTPDVSGLSARDMPGQRGRERS